jgi:hypothetical protein
MPLDRIIARTADLGGQSARKSRGGKLQQIGTLALPDDGAACVDNVNSAAAGALIPLALISPRLGGPVRHIRTSARTLTQRIFEERGRFGRNFQ